MAVSKKLVPLAALVWASYAMAQDEACKAPDTTAAILRCEELRLRHAEQALNAAYRRLAGELQQRGSEAHEREARALLVKAQRNWVAFREQDCKALFTARGDGSLRPWYYLNCMRSHAQLRTKQLETFRSD